MRTAQTSLRNMVRDIFESKDKYEEAAIKMGSLVSIDNGIPNGRKLKNKI